VGVEAAPLAEDEDLAPGLVGGQSGPEAGPAGADHQHIDGVAAKPVIGHAAMMTRVGERGKGGGRGGPGVPRCSHE
jgi:hypothetical protein